MQNVLLQMKIACSLTHLNDFGKQDSLKIIYRLAFFENDIMNFLNFVQLKFILLL